ncbi:hypothetical protein [Falsiroseomonas sp. HW251]|uniref:hypothetical protein n=1 Tax=Falsiroseomonas sp. HW251 TaxID=3390998 RepID=UPI003D318078
MFEDTITLPAHGTALFPGLRLDAYSLDLPERSGQQFGDRASHRAFDAILAQWRRRARAEGHDPLGSDPDPDRAALDGALAGPPRAAGLVQATIEDYAGALAQVVRRFLLLPDWQGTQRVVVGGGLRASHVGEVAIGRAAALLRTAEAGVRMGPIRHHPDEAGLIGAAHLIPRPQLESCDAVLTADLGGTSFRAGVVLPRLGVAADLRAAGVWRSRIWRHAEDPRADRASSLGRLAGMLGDLAGEAAAAGIALAPVVAVGVPGVLDAEGRLLRGAENLPGDWQAETFRLAPALARLLPLEGGGHPAVLLHNDAVAQGLSEAPFAREVSRWGVLTIGTGLGNARFTNLPRR